MPMRHLAPLTFCAATLRCVISCTTRARRCCFEEQRHAGRSTVDGVEMLVRQGAMAFELWTGVSAPVDLMRSVVVRELGRASH